MSKKKQVDYPTVADFDSGSLDDPVAYFGSFKGYNRHFFIPKVDIEKFIEIKGDEAIVKCTELKYSQWILSEEE